MKRYIEWEEFEQTFPIRLNAQQKSAVQSVNGPVLLLAVPGFREDNCSCNPAWLYDLLQRN